MFRLTSIHGSERLVFFGAVGCCEMNQSSMRVASPNATVSLMSVSASPISIW